MQSEVIENWVPSYLLLETDGDVCLYCGDKASQNEHLIPFSMISVKKRRGAYGSGLMSRSCPSCNAMLSNQYFDTLDRRVSFVSAKIGKQLNKIKCSDKWTQREISELSWSMRQMVESKIRAKQDCQRRVIWTQTPHYVGIREKMYDKCLSLYPQNSRLIDFLKPNWVWGRS